MQKNRSIKYFYLAITIVIVACIDANGFKLILQTTYEQDPVPRGDTTVCTIPFKRAGNLILIEGIVDGVKGNFILDTGSPHLVLNLTYFRDMNVKSQAIAGGISGAISTVLQTTANSFKMGNYIFKNIDADMVSLAHLENSKNEKILGLVGLNMLKNFTLLIDYKANVIKLKLLKRKNKFSFHNMNAKSPAKVQTMKLRILYNKLIIVGTIAGKKLNFIIDTGAESNIMDSRLPDAVMENINVTGRILLSGSSAKKVEAVNGNAQGLYLSGIAIQKIPVIITNLKDMCYAFDFCIDGMLGFDFLSLHQVEINFVTQEMYLWN